MDVKQPYFSSDYHLGHKNILKYDKRPFEDIDEHDEAIIINHNRVVDKDDDFYFLGDFSFNQSKTEGYLKRLNGNKFFIKGNHDNKETIALYKKYGTYLGEFAELKINGQSITLCHYALKVWNKSHHGSWHLYGHSHGSLPEDENSLSFDIGINCTNYYPLSFDSVKQRMEKKEFKPLDHHK